MMKRQVMEYRRNPPLFQMMDKRLTDGEGRQKKIKHVPGLIAMRGNCRETHAVFGRPISQTIQVCLPDFTAASLDSLPVFQLGEQKRGQDIAHHITGAHVHPSILIDLSAKKSSSIRAFLAN